MLRHLAPFLIGAVVGWMIFIFTLSENLEQFVNSPHILDFEVEWCHKYITHNTNNQSSVSQEYVEQTK